MGKFIIICSRMEAQNFLDAVKALLERNGPHICSYNKMVNRCMIKISSVEKKISSLEDRGGNLGSLHLRDWVILKSISANIRSLQIRLNEIKDYSYDLLKIEDMHKSLDAAIPNVALI